MIIAGFMTDQSCQPVFSEEVARRCNRGGDGYQYLTLRQWLSKMRPPSRQYHSREAGKFGPCPEVMSYVRLALPIALKIAELLLNDESDLQQNFQQDCQQNFQQDCQQTFQQDQKDKIKNNYKDNYKDNCKNIFKDRINNLNDKNCKPRIPVSFLVAENILLKAVEVDPLLEDLSYKELNVNSRESPIDLTKEQSSDTTRDNNDDSFFDLKDWDCEEEEKLTCSQEEFLQQDLIKNSDIQSSLPKNSPNHSSDYLCGDFMEENDDENPLLIQDLYVVYVGQQHSWTNRYRKVYSNKSICHDTQYARMSAQSFPQVSWKSDSNQDPNKLPRLYALGVLFYELFSGQLPPAIVTTYLTQLTSENSNSSNVGITNVYDNLDLNNNTCNHSTHDDHHDNPFANVNDSGHDNPSTNVNYSSHENPSANVNDSSHEHPSANVNDSSHVNNLSNVNDSSHANNFNIGKRTKLHMNSNYKSKRTAPSIMESHLHLLSRLKLFSLPQSIQTIIANLLDCHNGTFLPDNAYHSLQQLVTDLRLLIDEPDTYLEDVCVQSHPTIPNQLYGRQGEIQTIHRSFDKNRMAKCGGVVIHGSSGVGKSLLASHVQSLTNNINGIFISGKFDQNCHIQPLSIIANAFDEACDLFYRRTSDAQRACTAVALESALGNQAPVLVRLIPNLAKLLPMSQSDVRGNSCVDSEKRIHYLFSILIEMLSSFHSIHITLLLDDMQWSDEASLALLRSLLAESKQNKFFFFAGCFRDDEELQEYSKCGVSKWLRSISALDVVIQKIHLSDLELDAVHRWISDALHSFPRLTRPLSEVLFHKTRGNPLFLKRFLQTLQREGLIQLSLRRWVWDLDKISEQTIADDVVQLLTKDIYKLSSEQQSALQVASCIGGSVHVSLLDVLSSTAKIELHRVLQEVVKKGFMDRVSASRNGHRYRFVHDRVQQAAYQMILPHERPQKHLAYGLAILTHLQQLNHDPDNSDHQDSFFIAVNQINNGWSANDNSRTPMVAAINLKAGKRSIILSDFPSAFKFFEHGVAYLSQPNILNSWETQYDLTLQLHDAAAEAACVIGNAKAVQFYTTQIMTHASCFQDKLNAFDIIIRLLSQSEMHQQVKTKALEILDQLGEDINVMPLGDCVDGAPMSSEQKEQISRRVEEMNTTLNDKGDDYVLNLKQMQSKKLVVAMKLYQYLALAMQFINPSCIGLISLRMVELTLQQGLCSVTPLAFTYFGSFLVACGDPTQGYRLGKLALKLLTRLNDTEYSSAVIGLVCGLISWICEPIQSLTEAHMRGHRAGKQSGDVYFTTINYHQHLISSFFSGQGLHLLRKKSKIFLKGLLRQNQKPGVNHATPLYIQTVALINGWNEETPLSDEFLAKLPSEDDIISLASSTKNADVSVVINIHQMIRSFFYRNHEYMAKKADVFNKFTHLKRSVRIFFLLGTFYEGLISFCLAGKIGKSDGKWIQRAQAALATLKQWSNFPSCNFENKVLLLEAEHYRIRADQFNNDTDKKKELLQQAIIHYERAIQTASDCKFIHEEALSYELIGYFYLDQSNHVKAMAMFTKSRNGYQKWGANALVGRMEYILEQKADVGTILKGIQNRGNCPYLQRQEQICNRAPLLSEIRKRRQRSLSNLNDIPVYDV